MHISHANFLILARASFIEGTAILGSREAGGACALSWASRVPYCPTALLLLLVRASLSE